MKSKASGLRIYYYYYKSVCLNMTDSYNMEYDTFYYL